MSSRRCDRLTLSLRRKRINPLRHSRSTLNETRWLAKQNAKRTFAIKSAICSCNLLHISALPSCGNVSIHFAFQRNGTTTANSASVVCTVNISRRNDLTKGESISSRQEQIRQICVLQSRHVAKFSFFFFLRSLEPRNVNVTFVLVCFFLLLLSFPSKLSISTLACVRYFSRSTFAASIRERYFRAGQCVRSKSTSMPRNNGATFHGFCVSVFRNTRSQRVCQLFISLDT